MDEKGTPKFSAKLLFSSYIIALIINIIELTLTYIDKGEFDTYYILHLFIGISVIISTTITLCFENIIKYILIIINIVFWISNGIIPFYSLRDSKSKDFNSITLFLIIFKIFSLFIFNFLAARFSIFKKKETIYKSI